MKHNLEQWIAQLDYDDTCDISDRQVSDLIRNYAALEAKCSALAAENAVLKKFITQECHVAHVEPETFYEEEITRYVNADGYEPETTATDAFLAEVRNEAGALAVELFAQTLGSPYSMRDEKCYEDGFTRAIEVVRDIQAPRFAYKIRQAGM
ncbi:TPA: hypothetical protein LTW74_001432 [Enterobacter hormaechei]|nr:hypothetical protein [Enterobacter hormaechei]